MFAKFLFRLFVVVAVLTVMASASVARADTFGTGSNAFEIDFVPISGSTNPADTAPSGGYGSVAYDYRMGMHEITNDQWDKFKAELAPILVTGDPLSAYNDDSLFTGTDVPTDSVSWYEAAQFVNWLNTSTGHQAAYNFTGKQGTGDYTFTIWSALEAAGGTNRYRHKDAFYFLPTEGEWVKAAFFNGTTLQNHATKAGESLTQGDGTSGTGWNYYGYDETFATDPFGPWNVGSGSEELNGTYDMMGNIWEWLESPYSDPTYGAVSTRGLRGGNWDYYPYSLEVSERSGSSPSIEGVLVGFRVASVPEPGSITLLICGLVAGLIWWRRRK